MLHAFISTHASAIVARTKDRVRNRPWPSSSAKEIEYGVPLFLDQLATTLRLESEGRPCSADQIGATATRHGAELLAAGFNVSQVVHDYGDICQAVTEIAAEQHIPITVDEFHTLNHCLDVAIAGAVTEHARLTAEQRSWEEVERLGQAAHESRNLLNAAMLAFHALKRGLVATNGKTGAVLGRNLMGLRDLVDRTLSDVRLKTGRLRHERLNVAALVDEIAASGVLLAEYRGLSFTVAPVDPELTVEGDPQLLSSAVMNLLHNAFKYTPAGRVQLRVVASDDRLVIEVEDGCGGIPAGKTDLFQAFGTRSGSDRSGLGLGLSIARAAARAHGGDVRVRNMPGVGCVFAVDLPVSIAAPVAVCL